MGGTTRTWIDDSGLAHGHGVKSGGVLVPLKSSAWEFPCNTVEHLWNFEPLGRISTTVS